MPFPRRGVSRRGRRRASRAAPSRRSRSRWRARPPRRGGPRSAAPPHIGSPGRPRAAARRCRSRRRGAAPWTSASAVPPASQPPPRSSGQPPPRRRTRCSAAARRGPWPRCPRTRRLSKTRAQPYTAVEMDGVLWAEVGCGRAGRGPHVWLRVDQLQPWVVQGGGAAALRRWQQALVLASDPAWRGVTRCSLHRLRTPAGQVKALLLERVAGARRRGSGTRGPTQSAQLLCCTPSHSRSLRGGRGAKKRAKPADRRLAAAGCRRHRPRAHERCFACLRASAVVLAHVYKLREKRPFFFTVLVPVRASPVPVLCPGEGKFINFFKEESLRDYGKFTS